VKAAPPRPGAQDTAAAVLDLSRLNQRGPSWRDWILDGLSRACSVHSMVNSMLGPDWSEREARQAVREGQALLRLRALGVDSLAQCPPRVQRRVTERIFVSVAAYCEPHLLHTVTDAVRKSARPENLVFGVVDQVAESRLAAVVDAAGLAEVRYLQIAPAQARGVCWARALAFSLAHGERYLMQIDSHMLFEPGWDDVLLDQYDDLVDAHGSCRQILSTYPMPFEFEDGTPVASAQPAPGHVLVLRPRPGERVTARDVRVAYEAHAQPSDGPVRARHLAAGFLFTDARFMQEIPYDPYLYFSGEEHSLAARAFTHGWDIWHPLRTPLFHLYKTSGRAYAQHHWDAAADRDRDTAWHALDNRARERLLDLFLGRRNLGVYGLGSVRSIHDMLWGNPLAPVQAAFETPGAAQPASRPPHAEAAG